MWLYTFHSIAMTLLVVISFGKTNCRAATNPYRELLQIISVDRGWERGSKHWFLDQLSVWFYLGVCCGLCDN